jgi:hypothetical protein
LTNIADHAAAVDPPGNVALTASEARGVILNLAAFGGSWRAHRRFVDETLSGSGEARAELAALDALRNKDERFQIQRRILIQEIRQKIGAMQVRELIEVYEHCRHVETASEKSIEAIVSSRCDESTM